MCAIHSGNENVSRTNLVQSMRDLCTKLARIVQKTGQHRAQQPARRQQQSGASRAANRTQGEMLLRSPSATTTGHPLRVYAGQPVENKALNAFAFTCVNLLILKDLSDIPMKAHIRPKELTVTSRRSAQRRQRPRRVRRCRRRRRLATLANGYDRPLLDCA